jgi:RNA-directed DNA polymerase
MPTMPSCIAGQKPRQVKTKWGKLSVSFLPAISAKAAKAIRSTIRSWRTHRWTQRSIEELAETFNPVLRGWIGYYGQFYKSKLASVLGQFDYALRRWARRKFKRLKASPTQARAWLRRVAQQKPDLFVHWAITFAGMAER